GASAAKMHCRKRWEVRLWSQFRAALGFQLEAPTPLRIARSSNYLRIEVKHCLSSRRYSLHAADRKRIACLIIGSAAIRNSAKLRTQPHSFVCAEGNRVFHKF